MKIATYRKVIVILFIILILVLCFTRNVPKEQPVPFTHISQDEELEQQKLQENEEENVQELILDQRDRRVEDDSLYPPYNRSENRMFLKEVPLRHRVDHPEDSFRLIGYLTSEEMKHDVGMNNWRLYGRMRDHHQGEYYIMPSNKNIDMKIPLTREIIDGPNRLRDVYTLPQELKFNTPLLNTGKYSLTELPRSDLGSSMYY